MKQKIDEKIFYFPGSKNNNLLGFIHQPLSNHRNLGIIFCTPFAEEKLWSHRVFVNFSRILAKKGFTVLRFDYMGHGDSEGNFEDSTVETRLFDIDNAIKILKSKVHVTYVGLIGLRFGATLASISAERNKNIDFLILWQPVIKIQAYLQQCLRSNLATQMAVYKKNIKNRNEMTEDLLKGKNVNVDGYEMSGEFYSEAVKINLCSRDMNFIKPVHIIQISKNGKMKIKKELIELYEKKYKNANQNNTLISVIEEPFWSELKTYYQYAYNLFQKTLILVDRIDRQK